MAFLKDGMVAHATDVIADRSQTAKYMQSGVVAGPENSAGGGSTLYIRACGTVTFPVAYTAAPVVMAGGTTSAALNIGCAYSITTTQFVYAALDNSGGRAASNLGWLAVGI